jgi:hypothetical protein
MAHTDFDGTLVIHQGETLEILAIFHSSDFGTGGEYRGPTVFSGGCTNPYHQLITTVSTGVEFTQQSGDLSSLCIYHIGMRNDGTQDNAVFLTGFYDG